MFVSFSKRLKSMSGFRLGVGLRLTRRNCWYFLFVLVLVGCFYFVGIPCWLADGCFTACSTAFISCSSMRQSEQKSYIRALKEK